VRGTRKNLYISKAFRYLLAHPYLVAGCVLVHTVPFHLDNYRSIEIHYYEKLFGGGPNRLMEAGIATASPIKGHGKWRINGGGCFAHLRKSIKINGKEKSPHGLGSRTHRSWPHRSGPYGSRPHVVAVDQPPVTSQMLKCQLKFDHEHH